MTREEWLDDQVAAWLEAGPNTVPARAIERAVAHASAHPRRWQSLVGARRSALNRARLAELHRPPSLRSAFAALTAVAAVLVVAVAGVLLAFGATPNSISVAPALPTPTASATPTAPAPTPSVVPLATPPVEVAARLACATIASGPSTGHGDVMQYRGVVLRCSSTWSPADPRVDGIFTTLVSADERADESADIWGTSTLQNDGGSWSGAWRGTVDVGYTTHHIQGVFVGSGAYAGLRLRYTLTGAGNPTYWLTGTIEDAAALPPDGVVAVYGHTCATTNPGTVSQAHGVTHIQGVRLACEGDPSDQRLDGAMNLTVDVTEQADESATLQGTMVIDGSGGGWSGPFSGTVDPGYTTQRINAVAVGTGGYAGLTWSFTLIGTTETLYVATGPITVAL